MVDADDILLNDGAIVEYLSNVVSGGADQLDAPLEGLVVGLGAHERGQERMVNVDEVFRAHGGNELVREHLHVAREDNETASMFADERDLLLFRLPLVFFRDRYDEVRDAVEIGDALVVGMVGNDQRYIAVEFAALMPVEQVLQAMVILRDEDGDAGAIAGAGEPPLHLKVAGDGSEALRKLGKIKIKFCRIELNPRQKQIGCLVSMLVIEKNVPAVPEDEIGNRSNHAFAVGAGNEKDGGVVHRNFRFSQFLLNAYVFSAALRICVYSTSTAG